MTHEQALKVLRHNPDARLIIDEITPREIAAAEERCNPAVEEAWREGRRSMRGLVVALGIACAYVCVVLVVAWFTR